MDNLCDNCGTGRSELLVLTQDWRIGLLCALCAASFDWSSWNRIEEGPVVIYQHKEG